MLLDLTPDQEALRDTTERFLVNIASAGELRRLSDDAVGYDDKYWRRGAELGWTSLLVSEEHGGGTVSDSGLVDLTLIAYEFGRHAAPGPLVPCNLVAAALSEQAPVAHAGVLASLLSGDSVASWCFGGAHSKGAVQGEPALRIRPDQTGVVIDGVERPVEAAGRADHLLVTGRTEEGLTQVLVPTDAPGLSFEAMRTVDLTRRFWVVRFDSVRAPSKAVIGRAGNASAQVERQLQQALVVTNAETVGAMQAAFDMTVEWAFDRYSFGRPLASYQVLKHRFADMKSWLEAAHAIADASARAVDAGSPDAAELVSAAKAFIGDYGAELIQDCVQIHGGIGLTFDHDIHFFLRRLTANRALFGTPAEHRRRLADIVERAGEHR